MGIQDLDTATNGCKGAVEPIVIQEPKVTFNTALDGTVATVIVGAVTGEAAPYGGTFTNKGCEELLVTGSYLAGSTCDPCDVETLVVVTKSFTVPANTRFAIPDGYWTELSYVLENAATDAKKQIVSFQSFYTPTCPECLILVP